MVPVQARVWRPLERQIWQCQTRPYHSSAPSLYVLKLRRLRTGLVVPTRLIALQHYSPAPPLLQRCYDIGFGTNGIVKLGGIFFDSDCDMRVVPSFPGWSW